MTAVKLINISIISYGHLCNCFGGRNTEGLQLVNLKLAVPFRELCSACCTLDAQKGLIP